LVCGWLVLKTTFAGTNSERATSVRIWGMRGPLGAWITIWGAIAMLTSAPFDNWWHDAYGLDVKIISPPHSVLAAGMFAVMAGAVVMVSSWQNRQSDANRPGGAWFVIAAGGIQLALASVLLIEFSWPNAQHKADFYTASALMYPGFLIATARHRPVRWAATKVALVYLLVLGAMVWLLPLFPAEPKLAPIYNRVTHMVPPAFPLLLFVPALGIDVLFETLRRRDGWQWTALRILLGAAVFMALFVPTQWIFSRFLVESPLAENWFFAGKRFFGYMAPASLPRDRFWRWDHGVFNGAAIAWTTAFVLASAAGGLAGGSFLAKVRR
jgi:hypothetical protein